MLESLPVQSVIINAESVVELLITVEPVNILLIELMMQFVPVSTNSGMTEMKHVPIVYSLVLPA